jgi:hypothetical protein
MEEILDQVLVREQRQNGIDYVMYIKNLPRHLIYQQVPKMVTRYDRDGYTDGTQAVDPSGEKVWALLPGLSYSPTFEKSIMFDANQEVGRTALKALDTYVNAKFPRDIVLPERVAFPQDITDGRSNPIPLDRIPVLELPALRASDTVSSATEVAPLKKSRNLTDEQRVAMAARLAKARAARKAKAEAKNS